MGISVLDPAEGALPDPRKFSSTNNLRLVKKNFSSSKLSAHMKKYENHGILTFSYTIVQFGVIIRDIFTFL